MGQSVYFTPGLKETIFATFRSLSFGKQLRDWIFGFFFV